MHFAFLICCKYVFIITKNFKFFFKLNKILKIILCFYIDNNFISFSIMIVIKEIYRVLYKIINKKNFLNIVVGDVYICW